ncbi:AGE family epimerase/isomerase [Komagataeibacter rhaeticus]|uniref:Mannose-6-phosphate isomerase n=1 Tax=Komagataeibacter rhaeticus TaxID=215221 RepID=A0A181C6E8_9PROT|nr:AGE family epimerase/isomerase [Komagataeibacter rhaeticus]QIP34140.1 mannose-6-phosphate isomerase [Komagataeibacter rhaeticus]QOC46508.1 AGE family epimerase/isomerase [Komagataeibacter rhaeticus]QOC46649.1 AGE family epimerase/isomerase [Komagataeibacter rhaeticus]WPP20982.1 AGE family epimerase/isomerase [Komagataeibacter rhaeticus]SAY47129.1 Cellobiose 2-epimerase [Komagataeibacter rhaeticus]
MKQECMRVRTWLYDHAWPYWAAHGVDRVHGGFVEYLDLAGRDGGAPFKRVRAQARQLYCFSQAALLGLPGAREISDNCWQFFDRHARRGDGGWARRMDRTGVIIDPTSDAYDLAFVLLAHAWRYRLTRDPVLIESAAGVITTLNSDLKAPGGLGWLADAGTSGPRQQNPHMHIMEAALEMLDASGDARFAALAHQVADLFLHHIIDRKTGVLREFFTADWKPLDSAEGHIIEPGHMLEWVWILVRAHRLLGLATLDDVQRLYAFATCHGTDAHTGLIYDQIRSTGAPLSRDSRLWPQTEALKAHIAMMETFGLDTSPQISVTVDNLFRHYLDHAPLGTWIDHRRFDGSPKVDKIPSTSLYHLQLAFTELLRAQSTPGYDTVAV